MKSSGTKMVFFILGCSILLGIYAFYQYRQSEKFLLAQMKKVETAEPATSPLECLDRTIDFAQNCQAMETLCKASVSRYMAICLSHAPTENFCKTLGDKPKTTHFGYQGCHKRKLVGLPKKACAIAYRTIERHCRVYQ